MKHINVSIFVPHLGCPHMCSFCNQRTISGKSEPPTADDVRKSVEICLNGNVDPSTSEIAFFGGSFTAIDRNYMTELLESAYEYVAKGYFKGIRISTRPDCIDREVLSILKKYGVTSIELGCQSMNDDVLLQNDRGHTAADTENAAELIHEFGFEFGAQMMTGLLGDTDENAIETARRIIALKPATVRIYPTIVLEGTELANKYRKGEYNAPTLDESIELCSTLLTMFENAGVRVIRLGLHSGGNVEDGFVAGPYHPAFREKCESRIYRRKIEELLKDKPYEKIVVFCAVGERSKVVGQKKENILYMKSRRTEMTVEERENIQKGEIQILCC